MLNNINLHFINQCNYTCKYCFASKEVKKAPKFRELCSWIDKFEIYFKENKVKNPRINLVGGEPLLYKDIIKVINYIHAKGILVSIVTNGSLLNESFLNEVGNKLFMIGISIDSLNEDIVMKIGRCDNKDKTLKLKNHIAIAKVIKSYNIKLKINIVVSRFNHEEDFTKLLRSLKADRIKFLEMYLREDMDLTLSKYKLTNFEFNTFSSKYKDFDNVYIESNDKIDGGYFMINYKGDILVNKDSKIYNCGNIKEKNFKNNINSAKRYLDKLNYGSRKQG